jgi:hypothetical protein
MSYFHYEQVPQSRLYCSQEMNDGSVLLYILFYSIPFPNPSIDPSFHPPPSISLPFLPPPLPFLPVTVRCSMLQPLRSILTALLLYREDAAVTAAAVTAVAATIIVMEPLHRPSLRRTHHRERERDTDKISIRDTSMTSIVLTLSLTATLLLPLPLPLLLHRAQCPQVQARCTNALESVRYTASLSQLPSQATQTAVETAEESGSGTRHQLL